VDTVFDKKSQKVQPKNTVFFWTKKSHPYLVTYIFVLTLCLEYPNKIYCICIINKYLGDARKLLFLHYAHMFARIGMLLIVVSRLLQLNYSRNGRKEMQATFLVLQAIGIFLIAISSFAD